MQQISKEYMKKEEEGMRTQAGGGRDLSEQVRRQNFDVSSYESF